MKSNKILYMMLLSALTVACNNDEETLTPSGMEKNWYVIEDSSDPVDHQIYQFYQETGIPVFYNDTIGTDERVDNWGNKYTHYEVLRFSTSSLGGTEITNPFQTYQLCSKDAVVDGLNFLKTDILPVLPKSIKIQSFLLLNTLTPWNVNTTSNEAFKGLNTVAVSRISELGSMSSEVRQSFRASVLNAILSVPISSYTKEMEQFYSLTRDCYKDANLYGCYGWYFYNRYGFTNPKTVGFLKEPNPYDYGAMPNEKQDVGMYIQAIFSMSEADFKEMYGTFDVVMSKYNLMLSILKNIGVAF